MTILRLVVFICLLVYWSPIQAKGAEIRHQENQHALADVWLKVPGQAWQDLIFRHQGEDKMKRWRRMLANSWINLLVNFRESSPSPRLATEEENEEIVEVSILKACYPFQTMILSRSTAMVVVGRDIKEDCDWTQHGVGRRSSVDGIVHWCCTYQAIEWGLCKAQDYGHLILDRKRFTGNWQAFSKQSDTQSWLSQIGAQPDVGSHDVRLLADCRPHNRERVLRVLEDTAHKAQHGKLPGDYHGLLYFYVFLALLHVWAILWCLRTRHASRLIDKMILGILILGLLETLFNIRNLVILNHHGAPRLFSTYMAVITGCLKQGVGIGLAVLAGSGWGLVHDVIVSTRVIVIVGAIYTVLLMAGEFIGLESSRLAPKESLLIMGIMVDLLLLLLNVIFVVWALRAVNRTVWQLQNCSEQSDKCHRYKQLRCVYTLVAISSAACYLFQNVNETTSSWYAFRLGVAGAIQAFLFLCGTVAVAMVLRPVVVRYAPIVELPGLGPPTRVRQDLAFTVSVELQDDSDRSISSREMRYRDQEAGEDSDGQDPSIKNGEAT